MVRFFRVTVFSGKSRHHGVPDMTRSRRDRSPDSEIGLMEYFKRLADFEICHPTQ
jgi:hypothetical protein